MENFKIFIILFIILSIFYFTESVPFCTLPITAGEDSVDNSIRVVYSADEVLEIKNYNLTFLSVHGTSMVPTIEDNSKCLCVKKENYEVGNIVFFMLNYNNENLAILHRINSINGDTIITKGDNNNFTDPSIIKDDVLCFVPNVPRYLTFIE